MTRDLLDYLITLILAIALLIGAYTMYTNTLTELVEKSLAQIIR